MQKDMKGRRDMLERRHQNFESFIASMKHDKHRPDMEFFHGPQGIEQAYLKLLESGDELLTQMPVQYLAEDDPLRAFRVEYFRKRQYRKIFQRILAPDTPLARRFQSRDPFEYRKTLLIPEGELPIAFERTIVGNTILCFDLKEQTACGLQYPALAEAERASFDALWRHRLALENKTAGIVSVPVIKAVPLSTRIFSQLREFFLSRRSLLALLVFALVSAGLTFGLYQSNRELNLERLKEKVLSIAATGALQFDSADVDAIWTPEDINKPEYAKLIATLSLIRRSNTDIQYVYIMRRTNDPAMMAFVADADASYPLQKKDFNGDGIINDADALSLPGDLYDDLLPPFLREATDHPIVDTATDQWGSFISAQAPIRDKNGNGIAIIGIDMFASNLEKISAESFTPVYAFFGFFLLFVLIKFWSENRSLMEECWRVAMQHKRICSLWIIFLGLFVFIIGYGFQAYMRNIIIEQTGERLKAIAVTTAQEFDPVDLEQLHWARDMKTEVYQRSFKKLNDIRNKNPTITYAYIMRSTREPDLFEFVVDSDGNFNLPYYSKFRIEDTSPFSTADVNVSPGIQYFDYEHLFANSLKFPSYGTSVDQWGSFVSGCAPIPESTNEIVCFDVDLTEIQF